jgi:class 3 adenylate cyclase
MLLQTTEQQEPRYDAETLRKVTALAQELQLQHQETLTSQQIESIGAEIGLEKLFIRQALAEVTARAVAVTANPLVVPPSVRKRLRNVWWGTSWFLIPIVGIICAMLRVGEGPTAIAVLTTIAALIGTAIYLNTGEQPPAPQRAETATSQALPAPPTTVSRAELVKALFALEQELSLRRVRRAFMSVDVVQSTQMKRDASDLAVEYSFGQFREWVEGIVRQCGGEVQSVAGDGLMSIFPQDAQAVRAGRLIQEGLPSFNSTVNRLSTPFRVRCGVNAGVVPLDDATPLGHLNSAVLDRAATLQKLAEPGSVVVDASVAAAALVELGGLQTLPDAPHGEPAFAWKSEGETFR